MARRKLPNGQIIDDGQPARPPATPGTTFAREAQPPSGLTLPGGATSTAGARLAAAPSAGFGASPVSQPPPYDPSRAPAQFAAPAPGTTLPAPLALPSNAPVVLGGTPADSAAAVRGALLKQPDNLSSTVAPGYTVSLGGGKIAGAGSVITPVDPRYGRAPGVTDANPAPQDQYGGTGIIGADGKEISAQGLYGATGRPSVPQESMSPADQQAAILKAYPQVGVAGSPENKLFVDSYKQNGTNSAGLLDLAHSLFAPTAQQVGQQYQAGKAQVAADQAALAEANQTPEQKQAAQQAQQQKQQSNTALLKAAGDQVTDNASTVRDIGAAIPEVLRNADTAVAGAFNSGVGAVKNFFSGLTGSGDPSSPATTLPAPKPSTSSGPSPFAAGSPLTPPLITPDRFASDVISAAPISPVTQPPVLDPDELRRRAAAAGNVANNP